MYYCAFNNSNPTYSGSIKQSTIIYPSCGASGNYINYVYAANNMNYDPFQTNPVSTSMGLCPTGQSCKWNKTTLSYACISDTTKPPSTPPSPPPPPPPDGGVDSGDTDSSLALIFAIIAVIIVIFLVVVIIIIIVLSMKKPKEPKK